MTTPTPTLNQVERTIDALDDIHTDLARITAILSALVGQDGKLDRIAQALERIASQIEQDSS